MVAFCLSSSLRYFSASLTMRSISSLLRRPLSLVMVILFSLLVDFSTAVTFKMPLASMSKVTSIWGTPLGAGGMPVNSNLPSRLVVGVGGEGLGLLGGNGGVPLDESGHHASSGFDTQRQGGDVQQQQILDLFGLVSVQDGRLDCSSVRNSFIRVDGFVELLAVEEVLQQFLDLGDTRGSADQHDVVDLSLVHLGVADGLLHRLHRGTEQVSVQFLESGSGDGGTTEGALVAGQLLLVFALELLHKVVDHAVVEVLATQMGIAGGGLDLEDTILDGQDGDVEGTAAKIEDEHVALSLTFLVQAVRFGSLLHLGQHHAADLLRIEGLVFTLVANLDFRLGVLVEHLKWPVLHVSLNGRVIKTTTNQTFGI
nr:unnamed protein product [Callosobruchus chinensis]